MKLNNNNHKNKKGQFLHLIPLFILIMLGVFLVFLINSNSKDAIQEKGVASSEFVEIYQEVQRRQLQIEHLGLQVFQKELIDYVSGKQISYCGKSQGVRILLSTKENCFLKIDELMKQYSENFSILYKEYSDQQNESFYWGLNSSSTDGIKKLKAIPIYSLEENDQNFTFLYDEDKKSIHAKASKQLHYVNEKKTVSYKDYPHFDINLGLDIDNNFSLLSNEAEQLLNNCANAEDLQNCLDSNLPASWKYGVCSSFEAEYLEKDRVVAFCANSQMDIFTEGEIKTLQYSFAIDFTPTKAFTVNTVSADYDSILNAYRITFTPQNTATNYNIYITDKAEIDFEGSVSQFMLSGFRRELFESKNIDIFEIDNGLCPDFGGGEIGFTYTCDSNLMYILDANDLDVEETYYFTVTSLIDESESLINGFVVV